MQLRRRKALHAMAHGEAAHLQSTQMEPGFGVAARKASTLFATASSFSNIEKTMVHLLASTAHAGQAIRLRTC